MERRLSAILAADMVGYSRLVEADETGTIQRQKALRSQFIDPTITKHKGRVVKSMGDGILVEFPSVVEAVQCAVVIQQGMIQREADVANDRRIQYRIGINLGDVIVEDGDIFGDGVNVAARLEQLAEPGGICISGTTYDHLKSKIDVGYESLGNQRVKNIEEPIRVYRVLVARDTVERAVTKANKKRRGWNPLSIGASLAILVGLISVVSWWKPWAPQPVVASIERMALPLPSKPSIVVLPFVNLSGDKAQEVFSDGMTDDLITDLSKLSDLFVIASNTSFTFKGKAVEIHKVAEQLGVRYVLEGSLRQVGNQVRLNAKLIDATTGGNIWADRYDGDSTDYFSVQDSFVKKIVTALSLNFSKSLQKEIGAGKTANLKAREAFQKGWELYRAYTAKSNAEAANFFKLATQLDPNYGRAYAALSLTYVRSNVQGWFKELKDNPDQTSTFDNTFLESEATVQAMRFLRESERNSSSMTKVASSQIYLFRNIHEKALREAAQAIALDPNDPEAQIAMGLAMITTGKPRAGLEFVRAAMRLNPSFPTHYSVALALGYFAMNDMERTAATLEASLEKNPGAVDLLPLLAASYAQLGRKKQAHVTYRLWKPEPTDRRIEFYKPPYHHQYRFADDQKEIIDRIDDGVFVASLPDEIDVPSLREELRTGDTSQRVEAILVLERFGANAVEAVPDLIAALDDKYGAVRSNAIIALGKIGPGAHAAIPALVAMQAKSDTRFVANEALNRIRGN